MSTSITKEITPTPSPSTRVITLLPSIRFRARLSDLFWILFFTLFLFSVFLLSASYGSYDLTIAQSWQALFNPSMVTDSSATILWDFRLPRLFAAVLCGSGLAIAGVVLQAITRNALASPGLIGVEAGASVTLLIFIIALPNVLTAFWLPFSAMAGGIVVAGCIYVLSNFGRYSPVRLILIGIGISSVLSAISDMLITYGDIDRVESALMWLGGSFHQVNWQQVNMIMLWGFISVPPILLCFRELNLLSLGDTMALSRGVNNKKVIAILLFFSVALTSASVAVAGTLTFVGLMAPHIARQFCGNRHGALLPLAAIIGGLLVLIGDTLGRTLLAPLQLPAGLIIVLFGAPYFIFLMTRMRK